MGLKLIPVKSEAVRKIGFDPQARMVAVQFTDSDRVYGYPHLTDEELQRLIDVLENHASLGRYIATVVKPNHDHERVQLEPAPGD